MGIQLSKGYKLYMTLWGCYVDTLLIINMHEGRLEAKVMAARHTKVKAIPCNKIEECKNYTCWLVARGFVNNISSSTMCFSVAKTLIDETA